VLVCSTVTTNSHFCPFQCQFRILITVAVTQGWWCMCKGCALGRITIASMETARCLKNMQHSTSTHSKFAVWNALNQLYAPQCAYNHIHQIQRLHPRPAVLQCACTAWGGFMAVLRENRSMPSVTNQPQGKVLCQFDEHLQAISMSLTMAW
jgi:hypothetical protein